MMGLGRDKVSGVDERHVELIRSKCDRQNFEKLVRLNNRQIMNFVAEYAELCGPASIYVRSDSREDEEYFRKKAIELGEELPLRIKGHTVHFDGYHDQGRDKGSTKFLVGRETDLGPCISSTDREEGIREIRALLKDIMRGKEMFVLFFCLGPLNSRFSIYAVQITDSAYVAHSEDILYRSAYEVFRKKGPDIDFFKYVHSAGELENNVSKNVDKRRIYLDFVGPSMVYTVNTQYAGNTVGFKKLSLRLTIKKADREKWLSEHMFIMGVHGPNRRKTYFTGAFPSFCGKTSTCMVPGETIVGDDIAYLRKRDGKVYAVNVERGIFGVIKDINSKDDPLIWEALNTPGEVIFSNILVKDGVPYWQGGERTPPEDGINFSGKWHKGKVDADGNEITFSHPNARYTIPLSVLKNCDPDLENPDGVDIKGIIYGGRDSDTWPPVFESFDWVHGVVSIAASLESETTAATLGKVGVRSFNLMANLDFLSIPIGRYIRNHLDFVAGLKNPPAIFGVNYFLRDESGDYLTGMQDKRVWLKWIELRVHGDVKAIKTPIGYIPEYRELKALFREVLKKDYAEEDYARQFRVRVERNIAKIDRISALYKRDVPDAPALLFDILKEQRDRLENFTKSPFPAKGEEG